MAVRQQQRRGTAAQWTSADPILSAAEIGYETDTNKFKIGDGTNRWATLNYFVDLNTTIAGAPGLLNSLDEIAAAIGDDPAFFTTVSTNLANHQADTTNIHGIANTALLVTQSDLSSALSGATVDQSALAGVGIDWNSTTEAFDIDSTIATKTYADNAASTAVAAVVNSAPAALDTLKELADALTADESTASSLATLVGTKAPIASPTFTGTVSGITKAMVGLGSVDNTADSAKPVSTATQTALDSKLASATAAATYAPIASPTFTGTVSGVTKSMVGLGNVDNTSDANKPVSTASRIEIATAKSEAISEAAIDASMKRNAAKTYADELIETEVTNRNSAISTAAADATSKVAAEATARATAVTAAIATASADATTKANSAITTATATASADATTKADAAKAFATAADITLRTAITTDIATAKSEAITAATNAVNAVVASAPAALDTLDELAAALGDDANYAATITTALSAKAPLASPALTGNPTAPTQTLGNDSTRVATTAFVKAAIQDISSLNLVLDGGGVE
jgi:hypothetical protein